MVSGPNPSVESRLGDQNYYIPGANRSSSPEDSNADYALVPPAVYQAAAIAQLPTAIPIQGQFTKVRADYNIVANLAYVRTASAVVDALGRNDQDEHQGAEDPSGTFTINSPSVPNHVLGVVLEWSLQRDTSSAFTIEVQTQGYKGMNWQPVDRNFTLRISGGDSANGGMFAFLFAQRMSADYACGSTNVQAVTAGRGGMQKAIVQPAYIPNAMTAFVASLDETAEVKAPGLSAKDEYDLGKIRVIVPTNIATGFSVLGRYITAGSPQMADVRAALDVETARGLRA
jgi:hypothetical protein